LFESRDPSKDQSYVLYGFSQRGLASTLFPVGDRAKTEIRELARQFELPNADKKDSQEICFVPNRDFRSFVKMRLADSAESPATAQRGSIRDTSGKIVGEHDGIAYYTVGQRKGLGLNLNESYYITRLDAATNTVVVGREGEDVSGGLTARDVRWISGEAPSDEFQTLVKIRYRHEPAPAVVRIEHGNARVRFETPQRAVSPGQAAVFYRWDAAEESREVLGGGTIQSADTR
jgi:tRNA-specific 2-thiouridylase